MKSYYFVLVVEGLDPDADEWIEALYESGCNDTSISWRDGAFTCHFHREATRLDEALISAYQDVTKAGATVTRFEPDSLVTLDEIAERSGLAPSHIAQIRTTEGGDTFPAPRIRMTTNDPLWDWSTVTLWLQRRELISRDVAIEARVLWEANTTLLLQKMQGADFEQAFSSLHGSPV